MFSKVYNNLCSVCVYLKSVCLGDMPARFSGHYLTGNQQVLIFHRIPARTASCTGLTWNRPEGMRVCFSTDPAIHSVSHLACSLCSVPSYSVLSWHSLAAAAAPLRTIRWIVIRPPCARLS